MHAVWAEEVASLYGLVARLVRGAPLARASSVRAYADGRSLAERARASQSRTDSCAERNRSARVAGIALLVDATR